MSIWDDFKYNLTKSTRLNQIILINVSVFVVVLILHIVLNIVQGMDGNGWGYLTNALSLHTNLTYLFTHPWIILTHMFLHLGIWHLLWNMLTFYWFGNIVGDLLGDRKVWPIYLVSGLTGMVLILFFANVFQYPAADYTALGASAAVMGFIAAATMIAPDYLFHLVLIGEVRLKYVAFFIFLIDLLGIANSSNTGGHLGHLGGALGGVLYILFIRRGWSIDDWMPNKKSRAKVIPLKKVSAENSAREKSKSKSENPKVNLSQSEIDRILDKINMKGFNSLTQEEKNTLDKMRD